VDYPFSPNDKVRAKDRTFARLNLVHECMAATAIQNFEGCHSETLLITVVVRELGQRQTLVPIVWVVQYTSSEHILKNPYHCKREPFVWETVAKHDILML
jgi:hypothetical protein